jgi:hypothetical protein
MYVIEPGQFESIRRPLTQSSTSISRDAIDDSSLRVVSTGRDTAATEGTISKRKNDGVSFVPLHER